MCCQISTAALKLYAINLDRSRERLDVLRAQFSKLGLDFTRIEAVDAANLDEGQLDERQACNIWTQNLTAGEIACFLSHSRALERFVADNVPYGVIFEDDVLLSPSCRQILKNTSWLMRATNRFGAIDVVKLETSGKKVWLGQSLTLDVSDIKNRAGRRFNLSLLKSTHIMAACYLISRPAAQRLLECMQKKIAPFDHFLFNFSLGIAPQFALYQLDPAIAIQAAMPSTLENERAIDKRQAKSSRRMGATLRREFVRVLRRSLIGAWGIRMNLFTKQRWKRIAFKDN